MNDLISRQVAIDTAEESRRLNHHQDGKAACAHEYEHRHFLKILMGLPSAEPHWIPVSERLPEELKYVLVCTKRGYVTCGYCVNDFNYGCVDKDFFLNLDDVVAWMPLPEPYCDADTTGEQI